MEDLRLEVQHSLSTELSSRLVHQLMGRLKIANFLDLPEENFKDYIRQVERDPLFRRLCFTHEREHKVISFRRFPKTDLASTNQFEFKEELLSSSSSQLDAESLVESQKEIVTLITRLGMEKFRRYFLYGDEDLTIPDIAERCGIPVANAERIADLVNTALVHHEVSSQEPPLKRTVDPSSQVWYSRIASLERSGTGFVIGYFMPSLARGRYAINYERLEQIKQTGMFKDKELGRIRRLLKRLELINTRKSIVYKVLESIIAVQADYLFTGNARDLQPFMLKKLAARLNVSLAMVSRAVQGKSIETPWGERPVRFFFPSTKWSKREMVRDVIAREEGKARSDEEIRKSVQEHYHVALSRRAVNAYRLSLKIESSYTRGKAGSASPQPGA